MDYAQRKLSHMNRLNGENMLYTRRQVYRRGKSFEHISIFIKQRVIKVHSLNSSKVSIQIQLKALPELSEWTLV